MGLDPGILRAQAQGAPPDPEVCRGVRQILVRALSSFYRRRVPRETRRRTGCVAFTQRFDSALRLNVHFHTLWPDGVFEFRSWGERAEFHRAPEPSGEEVEGLCRGLGQRIERWLRKRGYVDEDAGDAEGIHTLTAAAVQGRIPFGDGAGSLDPRLRGQASGEQGGRGGRCATVGGYSLHGGLHMPAGSRERLEKLCRYAARPAVVPERMRLSADGRKVVYGFKRRWRDGSTHVVLDPLALIGRLAALVPRPRVNLTTYAPITRFARDGSPLRGVCAGRAGRELVVPEVEEVGAEVLVTPAELRVRECRRRGRGVGTRGES
ncbi:MAG: transposase [Planctomycetota bacterium]